MEAYVSIFDSEKIKIRVNDYKREFQYENLKIGEYSFTSSTCYGLIGEAGSGNWALSYLITGWSKLQGSKILIDGSETSENRLRNISCYVGRSHYYDIEPFHKQISVKKAIELGIKKTQTDSANFQDIKNKFDLSTERVDRRFNQIGNEHWRASLAIGYAYNKKIYCLPFLESSQWENYYSIMLEKWLNILKNEESIIIIPTDNEETVGKLIDKVYYF